MQPRTRARLLQRVAAHRRLVACALAVLLALSSVAPAAAAAPPFEPYAALQAQVKGRQILKATIHPKRHIARVTLRDGRKLRARIPKGGQRTLVASLRAAGAKVHVKKKHRSALRLRYIALAIVVIAALVAAVYLVRRRRRRTPRAAG